MTLTFSPLPWLCFDDRIGTQPFVASPLIDCLLGVTSLLAWIHLSESLCYLLWLDYYECKQEVHHIYGGNGTP